MINFKKLDIETDPVEQSFEAGSYDLIIACQVLHATKNMETTMRASRSSKTFRVRDRQAGAAS
ncbi:hypothetical protein CH063_15988, partial [Colletotrichum higginsianum]